MVHRTYLSLFFILPRSPAGMTCVFEFGETG